MIKKSYALIFVPLLTAICACQVHADKEATIQAKPFMIYKQCNNEIKVQANNQDAAENEERDYIKNHYNQYSIIRQNYAQCADHMEKVFLLRAKDDDASEITIFFDLENSMKR